MNEKNPIKDSVRSFRREPDYKELNESDASEDPIEQFDQWIKVAFEKEYFEPNAMTLATSSKDAQPTARTVLLKDYNECGFTFFTDYNSRKGQNLNENPKASLVFYWGSVSRQVLIDGDIVKVDRKIAKEYFQSRPRASQIAAYASNQSHPIADREELETKIAQVNKEFEGKDIPCPDDWGGYCLVPSRIEFWQGRADRTHDRLCYTRTSDNTWDRLRLSP